MDNKATGASPSTAGPSPEDRLDSWKEIAAYLRREVRTVQRWEKSAGLPVHRVPIGKQGAVYAYKAELDAWYKDRRPNLESDAADSEESETSTLFERLRQPWVAVAALAAILIGGAYFITKSSWFRARSMHDKIRLVVLPFANLSGDAQEDYFSAGLTDEMITQLGRLNPQRLGVIAAKSSRAVAGKPLREIGRALDVQYALEGSVRRDANRVRIDVQLIQVSDETHLWADSYDRDLNNILQVQDEVGAAVASQIRVALAAGTEVSSSKVATRSVNPEAYDAYLWGRFYWSQLGDLPKSIESYQLAIQKDAQYALAYAGLASSLNLLGQVPYDDTSPTEAKPKARAAAEHAIQLDPLLGEAHAVLANVAFRYDWNFEAAEREFQRALALAPNDPTTYLWYSHYCIARNRLAQAMELNSRLLELEPVSPLFNTNRAEYYYLQRKFDAAITQASRASEQYPKYWLANIWLGSAFREKKMYKEALEQFSRARKLSNQPVMIALYGHALAVSGDAAGARRALADLQQLAQSRYVLSLYFAAIYTGLRENSAALDWLDRAYRERNDYLVYLGIDPIVDPLRSEPRFQNLLRRIGLPQ